MSFKKSSCSHARPRVTADLLSHLPSHLTFRDYGLLELLREHRVLTTEQIADCFFTNSITARHRLSVLYNLRLVDRFRPRLDVGSAPHHWVLDHAGWIVTSSGGASKMKWS